MQPVSQVGFCGIPPREAPRTFGVLPRCSRENMWFMTHPKQMICCSARMLSPARVDPSVVGDSFSFVAAIESLDAIVLSGERLPYCEPRTTARLAVSVLRSFR